MPSSPMVSHPSSPVTRRCHIIDNRYSMQVSENTVSKNTAADFHRRRLLIPGAVASCRSIALGFERDLHARALSSPVPQAGEPDELCLYGIHPARLGHQ